MIPEQTVTNWLLKVYVCALLQVGPREYRADFVFRWSAVRSRWWNFCHTCTDQPGNTSRKFGVCTDCSTYLHYSPVPTCARSISYQAGWLYLNSHVASNGTCVPGKRVIFNHFSIFITATCKTVLVLGCRLKRWPLSPISICSHISSL